MMTVSEIIEYLNNCPTSRNLLSFELAIELLKDQAYISDIEYAYDVWEETRSGELSPEAAMLAWLDECFDLDMELNSAGE